MFKISVGIITNGEYAIVLIYPSMINFSVDALCLEDMFQSVEVHITTKK